LVVLPHTVDVKFNSLFDQPQDFGSAFGYGDASRQVGDVSSKAGFTFFDYDGVAHAFYCSYFFNPACFKILFDVPGGTSMLGFPETVTVPGWFECLSCRWLPFVLANTNHLLQEA
jgi:hypothetical protein